MHAISTVPCSHDKMRRYFYKTSATSCLMKYPKQVFTSLLMIQLTINGEVKQLHQSINIEQFINQNNLQGKRIAIERNGEIVPRSQYAEHYLTDGDHLEVVVAVGGG
jgi:sulfur carrier protein